MAWAGGDAPLQSRDADRPALHACATRRARSATLHPYLGMAAHAIVVGHDGSVFIHLHPMGTFPMVAQQVFALRDRGDTTQRGRLEPTIAAGERHDARCRCPGEICLSI